VWIGSIACLSSEAETANIRTMTLSRPTSDEKRELRRGWTTGACATAATKAALELLLTGQAPDPVTITLPKGEQPAFALALEEAGPDWARCGIIKDAGDDPDVTHGALIIATLRHAASGSGLVFKAGQGVGTVTKAGLPLAVGEPAINPVPRRMMTEAVADVGRRLGMPCSDLESEIYVPDGARLAEKTWNPRLGILGGISILGTTGVVHPFSCAAWIHSIHRGIDVARANGLVRIAGATGSTSEAAVKAQYGLPDIALIDMGDFAGGMLKYLRTRPVPEVTIAGGFAKLTKLAQGYLDLHSARSQVDFDWLAARCAELDAPPDLVTAATQANTAAQVLGLCQAEGVPIVASIAQSARATAMDVVGDADIKLDIMIVDRSGTIIATAP